MILVPLPCPSFPANSNFSLSLCRRLRRIPVAYDARRVKVAPPAAVVREVDAFTEYSGYLFELSASEADSLTEYDISKIASIYRKKPLVFLRRVVQVGATLGKWFVLRYLDRVNERSEEMFKVRAAELRKILAQLGPAYIKIAQAISSRADLIPPSYLDELSLLQDRITPFSTEVAFDTIERELGLPIDVLFSEVSPEPVAAASLGQEMDYKREAENGLKFRQLYGGLQDVVVPEMYIQQTTRRVLVMQWVEGKKLSGVKDLYLVEVGVYCSFNQLLECGFYHADPHPGNLLRTYDGKLAYIDFGMMGEFEQELRDGFIEACLHLVNRDFDALAKDFITLGLLPPTADKDAVTKALTGVFQNAVAKGVRNISFGDLLGDLGTTMYKFKFQIPSYFSLVIRSLAVLEGIAIGLDPNYKVLGSTYPWIARKVLTDSSPKLKASLQDLLYEDGVFRIDRLESLIAESLRANTEKSLVKKPIEDDDSRMMVKQILSFTLTEKGAFVRELILQEFAKGLDALGLATLDSITSAATASLPFAASRSYSSLSDEDIMNLRTLQRLVALLSGLGENESSIKGARDNNPSKSQIMHSEEASLVPYQFAPVQEILPLLSIILELPPDLQQQILRLPADLASKLASRIAARTIRRIFL